MNSLIKNQMRATYNQLTRDNQDDYTVLSKQLSEVVQKLNRIEERFMEEDIDRELYFKYMDKYKAEKSEIERNITQTNTGVSNLDQCIEKAITISSNLSSTWASSNYSVKQKIQFLIFPDGIRYNKKNDKCRIERINSIFAYIACVAQEMAKQKSGIPELSLKYSTLVGPLGIEPSTHRL